MSSLTFLLLIVLVTLLPDILAFSGSSTRPGISVNTVKVSSPTDVVSLADLRYDEWIAAEDVDQAGGGSNDGDAKISRPPPSRGAFQMATAEIVCERSEAGATAFLARLDNDDSTDTGIISTAVGAAELSPIEFDGAIRNNNKDTNNNLSLPSMLYVTDVVTSSRNRRMGIANALMEAVEQYAYETHGDGTSLYLHVKPGNEAAQSFYTNPKRGYRCVPTKNHDHLKEHNIDMDRLEENSGTAGQILFCKVLNGSNTNITRAKAARQWETQQNSMVVAVVAGKGFGGATIGKAKSSTNKSKRKR